MVLFVFVHGACEGFTANLRIKRRTIHGIDFSGAVDAGRKIWIASGVIDGGALQIEDCRRAETLPGSGRGRERCLPALRDFIARQPAGVFGLDFSFGLPRALVKQGGWEEFVLSFPDHYPGPDEFRRSCCAAAGGSEWKRVTDAEARTPFSPYNLRLFRQTYYGIRDVLHPLVQDGLACVLPMQRPAPDWPWVLEVCPASTLKKEGLYLFRYKGATDEGCSARARILEGIEATGTLSISSKTLRSTILDDRNGDALDSTIAALATFRAFRDPPGLPMESIDAYRTEGFVYV